MSPNQKRRPTRLFGMMYFLQGMGEEVQSGVLCSRVSEDIEKIKRMGFNSVYLFDVTRHPELGTTWSQLWYPQDAPTKMKPLCFNPDLQEEIEEAFASVFSLARQNELKVVPAICYNIPLEWLWSHLDAAKRKSDGSLHYTVYYHECFRSEKTRWYTRGRLRQFLERYASDQDFQDALARLQVQGNDAWLEDGGRPLFVIHNDSVDRGFCYCQTCRKAWGGEFLPRLYEGIDEFNAVHKTRYRSFAEVPLPPNCDDQRLWRELSGFFTEGLAGWMEVIRSVIREYVPDALLSIVMKYPRSPWATQYPDWARLGQLCDVLFMDPYPMESGTEWNISGYAFDLETYRSISLLTNKPIMCQFQLASSYSGFDMKTVRAPTAREILQQFYVAIGRGAKGMVCWGLPPGIADDARPSVRLDEEKAIEVAACINREAEKLFLASEDTREIYGTIMLPYNYATVIRGEECLQELFGLYRFFSAMGLSANPTYLDLIPLMAKSPHRFRAMVGFNSLKNLKKDFVQDIGSWIKEGGMLLCGSDSMMRDENGDLGNMRSFNRDVLGSEASGESAEGDLQILKENPCLPKPGSYRRPVSAAAIKATTGDLTGIWSKSKTGAIVTKRLGRGLVIRVGLAGETQWEDRTVQEILRAFGQSAARNPIRVFSPEGGELVFSCRKGKDLILYLVNNEPHPQRVHVEVWPESLGLKDIEGFLVLDVLTQEQLTSARVARPHGVVCFQDKLPPLGSRAIRMRPLGAGTGPIQPSKFSNGSGQPCHAQSKR